MAEASRELWTTSQVAVAIRGPYRMAFDLLLSGAFGPPERRGRTWLVEADKVRTYVAELRLATPGAI